MLWRMPAGLPRERIGMMFIGIYASTGAARSAAAAAATRPDGRRRLVHGREMSGGKGGNLESLGNTGPGDDAAKRRKPAETGGNGRALHWRGTSGVAEIAENKFYVAVSALRLHRMRDHLAHHRRQRPFGHAVDHAPARAGREPRQAVGRGGGTRDGELEMEVRKSVAHQPVE